MPEVMERIVGMRKTFLARALCIAKNVTDKEVTDWCEADEPCGTTSGWQVDEKQGRIQCADDPTRVHIVVTA